jgi:predicted Zn-dependent protease
MGTPRSFIRTILDRSRISQREEGNDDGSAVPTIGLTSCYKFDRSGHEGDCFTSLAEMTLKGQSRCGYSIVETPCAPKRTDSPSKSLFVLTNEIHISFYRMKSETHQNGRPMTNSNRIETFKALVDKSPGNTLNRYGLANEYFKAGMYEEAIEEIRIYFTLKDDEGAAYRMLAEALLKLGRKEEAKEAYVKGIEAAYKHGHPGMAEEFDEAIQSID